MLGLRSFDEFSRQIDIDVRKSAGDGVSPGTALNCREPLVLVRSATIR